MFTTLSAMVVAVTMTLPSASVFGASYSQELQDAYNWAHDKGITTMSSIDNANMYGAITRAEMAKMLSVYAMEVLGSTANEAAVCEFTDIDSVKGDLHEFIKTSCQLGIMGQNMPNNAFRPYDTISRAEFGTALSRLLWGSKYEGGTPYYANHLNALKADGIMNQIANAESTKEIRGYVMLMLMRSEQGGAGVDCDDADIALACLDPEADLYKECPAACRENSSSEDNTDEKVKSGDLVVTADAATNRSAIKGAASDLDTLTFKTSEEVEITKVVLERYGYSAPSDIESVRLEDADGNKIAEAKTVNSKDQVTLSIKKDYRKVDGSFNATVVVELTGAASGSTIGFKVVDVTSTAKNVDLGNYRPYTYDIVTYDAVSVSLDDKGVDKDYNYEDGESYEVAKLKLKAGTSALEVNGFNLTNVYTWEKKLDLEDFVSKVEVSANGEALKGVNFTADDDELNVTFDSYEIAAKGNATFTVSITLKDFDEYGAGVEFVVKASSDAKITEKKTWARVSVTLPHGDLTDGAAIAAKWSDAHAFVGSKIKFTSKKLGSVDAAQGSDDIVVLDWEIEIAEAIDRWSFTITGNYSTGDELVEEMTLVIAGDEYTASQTKVQKGSFTGVVFTFNNVEIEKSGKFQILIDVEDDAEQGATIQFTPSISKNLFVGDVRYTEARENVRQAEVKGSVSFASKVTIQPSKASLENDLTKNVEFTTKETTRKTVFDGTYTSKKGLVNLNTALITGSGLPTGADVTFYLYVDGEEVATMDPNKEETFSDVAVEAGESVKVKVEAEIYSDEAHAAVMQYSLIVSGEDDNGNSDSGKAEENLAPFKIVDKWTFNITDTKGKDTVLLKGRNTTIAEFTIKPSNNNDGMTLEDLVLTGTINDDPITSGDIRLKIDGVEYEADEEQEGTGIIYVVNEEVPAAGYKAEIVLKNEYTGDVVVKLAQVNGKTSTKKYSKSFANALVYIDSQEDEWDYTQYTLGVDLYEDTYTVSNVQFFSDTGCAAELSTNLSSEVSDGDEFSIDNDTKTATIRCISYDVETDEWTESYEFNNSDFADYFKVNGSAWRVFSNNN